MFSNCDAYEGQNVKFEETWLICAALCINKIDFSMKFNERQGVWVATWKWSACCAPKKLRNRISKYPVSNKLGEEYEHELQTWIDNSWLLYSDEEFGHPKN